MLPVKAAILTKLASRGYKSVSSSQSRVIPSLFFRSSSVQRVLSAYTDDRPFSVDLIGAVIRQSTFIEKFAELRWLEDGHFGEGAEDELVLSHAISRYHAWVVCSGLVCFIQYSWPLLPFVSYLDLLSSSPKTLFVPTLDIDLVWHTHQMSGITYLAHCAKYMQYLIDQ